MYWPLLIHLFLSLIAFQDQILPKLVWNFLLAWSNLRLPTLLLTLLMLSLQAHAAQAGTTVSSKTHHPKARLIIRCHHTLLPLFSVAWDTRQLYWPISCWPAGGVGEERAGKTQPVSCLGHNAPLRILAESDFHLAWVGPYVGPVLCDSVPSSFKGFHSQQKGQREA